jgi:hypothetical protein
MAVCGGCKIRIEDLKVAWADQESTHDNRISHRLFSGEEHVRWLRDEWLGLFEEETLKKSEELWGFSANWDARSQVQAFRQILLVIEVRRARA